MELEIVTDFDTLTQSGEAEAAFRETGFVNRAIRLFDLREKIWKAYNKSETAIDNDAEAEAARRARTPGRIAFAIGAVACAAVVTGPLISLAAGTTLLAAAVATGLGLGAVSAAGGILCAITRSIMKSGPLNRAEERCEAMEQERKKLHARIEREIEGMDSQLVNQTAQVREEFRAAFRHASVKEEARLNKIHRARVEADAEEAKEAAQTAATMSTIAAMNSATAAMNAGRR